MRLQLEKQRGWERNQLTIAGSVVAVVLVLVCAVSPLLASALSVPLAGAVLVHAWRRSPVGVALGLNLFAVLPLSLYGFAAFVDGIGTLIGGSRGWTSFDVLTVKGIRPVGALGAVGNGLALALAAVVTGVVVRARAVRSERGKQDR